MIQDHPWVVWAALAVVLAVLEVLGLDLVLLMLAVGAGVAALASAAGVPLWASIVVFVVVSAMLLWLARPPIVARLHAGPTLHSGASGLVGRRALTLTTVDDRDGRVRLAGEEWSARTGERDLVVAPDTDVVVVAIDGATAVVQPEPDPRKGP